ncbi:MAG: aminotransferase class V-fold PLP-dependent enzyme [Microthrixaceae bacterium]
MPILPPPPVGSFVSDNAAGVSPEVMEALAAANVGTAMAYGDDDWTRRAQARLREVFDAPVHSYFCWGGTGANVVGLASVLRPWQAVLTAASAHIVVDECGAPARFTGSTIVPIPTDDGRLSPDLLAPWLQWQGSEHHPQPAVVSITQSTEMGTLYSVDEIGALCDAAHAAGMLVHLDGARIANALVATGSDLPTMVRDTGVDLMTLGLTKDGAMFGETVVFVAADARPCTAGCRGALRAQAGRSARLQEPLRRRPGARPARGRPVAGQRPSRQPHGRPPGPVGRGDPGGPTRRRAAGELAVRPPARCRDRPAAGVVVLLGLGPDGGPGAVDDQLRHHRRGRAAIRGRRLGGAGRPRLMTDQRRSVT